MSDFNTRQYEIDANDDYYNKEYDEHLSEYGLNQAAAAHKGSITVWLISFILFLFSFPIPILDPAYRVVCLFAFLPPVFICYRDKDLWSANGDHIMDHAKSSISFQLLIILYDLILVGVILNGIAAIFDSAFILRLIVVYAL